MLENSNQYKNITIADLKKITINDTLNQGQYKDYFYHHLGELWKYYLLFATKPIEIPITERVYYDLEMLVLDNNDKEQLPEIDWNYIDDLKYTFLDILKSKLGSEKNSDYLKPFIKSSVNSFVNKVLFHIFYNNIPLNPWEYTYSILSKGGCLHLVSDNIDLIKEYSPKLWEKRSSNTTKNISVLATNKKYSINKETRSSGITIDDRYSTQAYVFNYLSISARGRSCSKNSSQILKYLSENRRLIDDQLLKSNILLPLKRQGLIGSNTTGYYYIESFEDLKDAYDHHMDKLKGIQSTINMYRKKADALGLPSLD